MMWKVLEGRVVDQVVSTNDWLKAHHQGVGDWIRARRQSGGRGRGTHQWHSPEGNLYFSVCVPRREPLTSISLAVAVAVARLCNDYGVSISVKWPNDLLLDNKKCGGILSEVLDDVVVVGLGLNLVEDNLFEGASMIEIDCLDIEDFTKKLLEYMSKCTSDEISLDDIQREWISRRAGRKGSFIVANQTIEGCIENIDLLKDEVTINMNHVSQNVRASLLQELF